MYNLNDIFPDKCFTTLEKASLDTTNNKPMVKNVLFQVIKLDDYNRNYYQQELGCPECLRGADAFFIKNNKFYFVEFKNRYPTSHNIFEILEKMYASSIVIMDKLNINLSTLKQSACFVTVYTFKENCDEKKLYSNIPVHRSLKRIQVYIASNGTAKIKNIDKKALGLKKLEKYIYKEVNAIPVDYFQRYLLEESII